MNISSFMNTFVQSNQPPRSTQPSHPSVGRRNEYQSKGGDEGLLLFHFSHLCFVIHLIYSMKLNEDMLIICHHRRYLQNLMWEYDYSVHWTVYRCSLFHTMPAVDYWRCSFWCLLAFCLPSWQSSVVAFRYWRRSVVEILITAVVACGKR